MKVVGIKTVIKTFERLGYSVDRISGSHVILTKENSQNIVIPNSGKTVSKGTLRQNIHRSGVSLEVFNELLG